MSQYTLPHRQQQQQPQPQQQRQTHAPSRPLGLVLGVRRFGRNDFERFDQEAARGSHLCVGSTTIGKVDIDCKYQWKKAKWGVLGVEKRPAGVVYMDITFKQPHGWWLQNASVFVTVSEDKSSYALVARRKERAEQADLASDYAVQITDYFGPRFLTGTKTVRSESRRMKFTPTMGGPGVEVGGMGYESISSHEKVGRWVFKGNVGKPKGRDGLRTLHWELTENCLDPDQAHSQEFRTAFAFEHSRRPVYLRVEMEGRLLSKGQQLKHGMKRFSSHGLGRKDDSTLMHIDFGRDFMFERSLDAIAQGLDMTMQMENLQKAPVETPDPTPAKFTADTKTSGLGPGIGSGRLGVIEERHEPPQQTSYHTTKQQDALLRLLTQTTEDRRPISQAPRATIKIEEMEETLVVLESSREAEGPDTESVDTEELAPVATNNTPARYQSADEALLEMLKIPAILYILRVFVMITSAFSKLPQSGGGGRQPTPNNTRRVKPQAAANGRYVTIGGGGGGKMFDADGPFRLDGARVEGTLPGLSKRLVSSQAAERQANGFLQRGQQTRIRSW
ncbi:hypothetical protein PLICBS_000471 [Purpureocillium lilacinum]|uniref:uncharacterized protein n=1 Tax=Purpureocillium lilacinum TaxID=33203 RepID=UPI00207E710A|nr:hypothetical protein PLICBS_000471 [Purpureocillium lilacinum]